jgi:hypothetical protein
MGAFGLSWILLFTVARSGAPMASSFAALGWVHLVALGWITLIALSILIHVIQAFLDIEWRLVGVAKVSTLFFAAGAAILVGGFLGPNLTVLQCGAWIALLAVLTYAVAACTPLIAAMRRNGTARAVARAFGATLALLLVTASLGLLFALALRGIAPADVLRELPKSHALLGIAGWLSLLVMGVSARTMGPIAGERSRRIWAHVASSTLVLSGALLAAVTVALKLVPAALAGCGLILVGILTYTADLWRVLLRATVAHRPPQVLMASGALAAVVAAVLFTGSVLGQAWGPAAVYVALLGWIGSAVLAHIHHIGVRVLLTNVRGDDDETRPESVLDSRLTWITLLAYEAAVVLGTLALLRGEPAFLQLAALVGLISFLTTVSNLAAAYRAARQPAT